MAGVSNPYRSGTFRRLVNLLKTYIYYVYIDRHSLHQNKSPSYVLHNADDLRVFKRVVPFHGGPYFANCSACHLLHTYATQWARMFTYVQYMDTSISICIYTCIFTCRYLCIYIYIHARFRYECVFVCMCAYIHIDILYPKGSYTTSYIAVVTGICTCNYLEAETDTHTKPKNLYEASSGCELPPRRAQQAYLLQKMQDVLHAPWCGSACSVTKLRHDGSQLLPIGSRVRPRFSSQQVTQLMLHSVYVYIQIASFCASDTLQGRGTAEQDGSSRPGIYTYTDNDNDQHSFLFQKCRLSCMYICLPKTPKMELHISFVQVGASRKTLSIPL